MLERKFTSYLTKFLTEERNKILLVNGARQIGKSYLIRYVGRKLFSHFVEINLKEDKEGDKVFADVRTTDDLYMRLSNYCPTPLGDNTQISQSGVALSLHCKWVTVGRCLGSDALGAAWECDHRADVSS